MRDEPTPHGQPSGPEQSTQRARRLASAKQAPQTEPLVSEQPVPETPPLGAEPAAAPQPKPLSLEEPEAVQGRPPAVPQERASTVAPAHADRRARRRVLRRRGRAPVGKVGGARQEAVESAPAREAAPARESARARRRMRAQRWGRIRGHGGARAPGRVRGPGVGWWQGVDRARVSGVLVVLLACVPGLAAVLALLLCAQGVERSVAEEKRPVAARPVGAYQAARPAIVPRSAWLGADARRAQPPPRYDDKVVAVFVHHTDSPNGYDCADTPRIIRYLYAGQTGSRDWDDIGYNFLVDRCGTIYEGRAGGVDRAVTGAHTQGFNHRTAGIAALGTFTAGVPVPKAMTDAIAAIAAWKLGLSETDPRSTVALTSSNNLSRYSRGTTADLPAIAGHNEGFMTTCPGAALSARLPDIRETAARLQGRH